MNLRFVPNERAEFTVLGHASATAPTTVHLLSVSNKRLCVAHAPATLPARTAVKIEWPDHLVLGEIIGVQDGRTTVLIRHALHAREIAAIRQGWV